MRVEIYRRLCIYTYDLRDTRRKWIKVDYSNIIRFDFESERIRSLLVKSYKRKIFISGRKETIFN